MADITSRRFEEKEKDVSVGNVTPRSTPDLEANRFHDPEHGITEPTPADASMGSPPKSEALPGTDGGVLSRVISRVSTRITIDPGPPPDGGVIGWTQAIAAHFVIFNTWGYIR